MTRFAVPGTADETLMGWGRHEMTLTTSLGLLMKIQYAVATGGTPRNL